MKTNVSQSSIDSHYAMPLTARAERRSQVIYALSEESELISCAELTRKLKALFGDTWENSLASARVNELVSAGLVEQIPDACMGVRTRVNGLRLSADMRAAIQKERAA